MDKQTFFNNLHNHCNSRKGSMGLYAVILMIIGLVVAVFVFIPDYNNMQNGIYSVSCADIRTKLDSAIEDYNINNSKRYSKEGQILDLDTLKEKGYLRDIKYCPLKGIFMIGKNGKVICTLHSKGN